MKAFLTFITDRLRERSTWLGLISLGTALGLVLTPEQADAVVASGMALAGLLATMTTDIKK